MRHPEVTSGDQVARQQHFTLLELLDRLLEKGVMAKGEIVLSVAEIDLVYLNLGVLLSSVKTVEQAAGRAIPSGLSWLTSPRDAAAGEQQRPAEEPTPPWVTREVPRVAEQEMQVRALETASDHGLDQSLRTGASVDSAAIEKGLVRLILTLVDLIRKLMEKQALRRIEAGQLSTEETERVGNAFFLLDEKIEQIKETFGVKDEDLQVDLGPLGELLG